MINRKKRKERKNLKMEDGGIEENTDLTADKRSPECFRGEMNADSDGREKLLGHEDGQ